MIDIIISIIRIVFGLAITLFLPGFAVSLLLFKNKISISERIAFSCLLSIVITILMALLLDMFIGIDTTGVNMFIALSLLTFFAILAWSLRSGKLKKFLKKEV
jgi:uncharacterized membrane protein